MRKDQEEVLHATFLEFRKAAARARIPLARAIVQEIRNPNVFKPIRRK